MSVRSEAFSLYKNALRVAKNWTALNVANTQVESMFIKNKAREEWLAFQQLKTESERIEHLKKAKNWLDTSVHYRIPYTKPYYFPQNVSHKKAKQFGKRL